MHMALMGPDSAILPREILACKQATDSLAHDDVKLMLHLGAHVGRDGGRQLVGGALEGVDQLPELTHQSVPGFLLSGLLVLHVGLQLLNIYKRVTIDQSRLEVGLMASSPWPFATAFSIMHKLMGQRGNPL